MAGGYNDGLPSVLPRQEGPVPFMRDNAGQSIARGIDKLSTGIQQAGAFYDDSAANEQFNEYQRQVTTLMRGDPNKTSPGPDGATVTDTGFMGLNGRAAMDARPKVEAELDKLDKMFAERLSKSPNALRTFQSAAQRYRLQTTEQISSHASAQSDVWFKQTAIDSAALARDRIALDPENPAAFKSGAADLINNYVKIAQLNGAQPGDAAYVAAVADGKRDALSAQIAAIGVTNPKRAIEILEKNKAIAGEKYDELYSPLRARATEQAGIAAASRAYEEAGVAAAAINDAHIANPAQPIYQQTSTAIPGGYSAAGLARTVQIESGGRADAVSPSGKHVGLTQFSEATWKEYGEGDRADPKQSILAAQRYAAANAKYLRGFLGRQPTDAELYLAHQQGAGGAQKLLMNPDAPAASLIGVKAVVQNGGKADMTASEFVAMWAHRFNKTTPANAPMSEAPQVSRSPWAQRGMAAMGDSAAPAQADIPESQATAVAPPEPVDTDMLPRLGAEYVPADAKADAYDRIFNDPNLNDDEKQAAIIALNSRFAVDKIRQDEAARAKKEASDKALSDYTTKILTGQTDGISEQIANDPYLEPSSKMALINAMQADADRTVGGAQAAYGTAYYKVLNQVLADPGDPSRISDSLDVLKMASDPAGSGITMQGATKLIQIMKEIEKNPDAASVTTTKAGMLEYGKSILSFNSQATPDPEGEMLFNAKFVAQFEAEYSKWVEDKKNPFEFLTKENIDRIASGLRSPREFEIARALAATGAGSIDISRTFPVPQGADKQGWNLLFGGMPQTTAQGKAIDPTIWSQVLGRLYAEPTPSAKKAFDFYFGNSGLKADDILLLMTPAGVDVPTMADKPAPPPVEDPARPGPHAVINGVPDLGLPMP